MSRFIVILVVIMIISRMLKRIPRPGNDTTTREIPRPGQDPRRPEPPSEEAPVYDVCRKCGTLVDKRELRCPSCGKYQRVNPAWVVMGVAILIFALVFLLNFQ